LIEIHEDNMTVTKHSNGTEEMVSKVLSGLPQRDREVLVLRYFLELTLREINNYLDIGLSATKMRLYRSLELFESVMQKQERLLLSATG
jgi:RNA polymerase sigma-70 factor (ECF subfamily)